MRTVTLVDERNTPIGSADLLEAHTGEGKLHRAFSVYVFSDDGESLLIQQRAREKMLFAMFWANTCCSHPFENEDAQTAGARRLQEELGFSCALTEAGTFVYRAEDPEGKGVEHEHVTLLVGKIPQSTSISPNAEEVAEWKWVDVPMLITDMKENKDAYAPWFHLGLRQLLTTPLPTILSER
ncbi:MAG: isopentenyl-diphosphate Delta-isomerase [Candidatus Peregrinibacteria bacterium]|nr:isopentenyl-diphosphate Delta-isomerase [Candidatus Peregrinibacteria bacterium]